MNLNKPKHDKVYGEPFTTFLFVIFIKLWDERNQPKDEGNEANGKSHCFQWSVHTIAENLIETKIYENFAVILSNM